MIKDEFNNIKVPYNLDDFIDQYIDEAEQYKKKSIIKNFKKSSVTAAGITLIVLTLGLISNPAMAVKLPLIGSVFENIQDSLELSGEYSNYADEINESVYDNGVSIKLSEVYCDGESLYISYLVNSDVPFKYIKYPYDPEVDYDITEEEADKIEQGQLLYEGEGKVDFRDGFLDNSGIGGLEGRYIDDNTFVGVEKYNLREMFERHGENANIPDNFEFSISITNIRCRAFCEEDKDQVIKGNWNFKVNVPVDKTSSEKIPVNLLNDEGIGVKEIVITPFELKVITEHPKESKKFEYSVCISDENDKDIPMDFGMWNDKTSVTTFPRNLIESKKIKISLYKNTHKSENEFMDKNAFYETEVNLDK